MSIGTVKWFNNSKGFGFIAPADGGKDVFVHISVLEACGLSTLQENQEVNIETEMGQKGPQVTKIAVAG